MEALFIFLFLFFLFFNLPKYFRKTLLLYVLSPLGIGYIETFATTYQSVLWASDDHTNRNVRRTTISRQLRQTITYQYHGPQTNIPTLNVIMGSRYQKWVSSRSFCLLSPPKPGPGQRSAITITIQTNPSDMACLSPPE
ncbi:hypothetical protein WDU94_000573 [Cyamophila willieti]